MSTTTPPSAIAVSPVGNPVICEHCDSVYRREPLRRRQVARCSCCGAELYRHNGIDLEVMLALTMASLVVFLIANSYPIMTLEFQGQHTSTTLLHAVLTAFDDGIGPVAVIVALSVFLFPLLQIALFAYVLLPLRAGRVPRAFVAAMNALRQIGPWSMVEVFLLGMLVAVVKLGAMASVTPDAGLWGFGALTCLLTALNSFDTREIWERAVELGK